MRRLIFAILLPATFALATPGLTQSVGDAGPTTSEAIRLAYDYSRCMAREHRDYAQGVVRLPFRDAGQAEAAVDTVDLLCAGPADKMTKATWPIVIGGMAEALFVTDHGGADASAVVARGAALTPRNAIEDLALCLVRANPSGTRAVLATQVADPNEDRAIRALTPDLGKCVTAGVQTRLDKPSIRGMIAVAYYLSANYGSYM